MLTTHLCLAQQKYNVSNFGRFCVVLRNAQTQFLRQYCVPFFSSRIEGSSDSSICLVGLSIFLKLIVGRVRAHVMEIGLIMPMAASPSAWRLWRACTEENIRITWSLFLQQSKLKVRPWPFFHNLNCVFIGRSRACSVIFNVMVHSHPIGSNRPNSFFVYVGPRSISFQFWWSERTVAITKSFRMWRLVTEANVTAWPENDIG